jgi:hypothetical protein
MTAVYASNQCRLLPQRLDYTLLRDRMLETVVGLLQALSVVAARVTAFQQHFASFAISDVLTAVALLVTILLSSHGTAVLCLACDDLVLY